MMLLYWTLVVLILVGVPIVIYRTEKADREWDEWRNRQNAMLLAWARGHDAHREEPRQ